MFGRFTEKARRVIFFARFEASNWGSATIESSHLLLGLLREDKRLFLDVLYEQPSVEIAAQEMGLRVSGTVVSTSVDLPLSHEVERSLAYAAEEAERLQQPLVFPGHLLLGLLKEPGPAHDFLKNRGLDEASLREFLRNSDLSSELPPSQGPVSGQVRVHYTPSPNERIVAGLREQFERITARLRPEIEPAVSFTVRSEKQS